MYRMIGAEYMSRTLTTVSPLLLILISGDGQIDLSLSLSLFQFYCSMSVIKEIGCSKVHLAEASQ